MAVEPDARSGQESPPIEDPQVDTLQQAVAPSPSPPDKNECPWIAICLTVVIGVLTAFATIALLEIWPDVKVLTEVKQIVVSPGSSDQEQTTNGDAAATAKQQATADAGTAPVTSNGSSQQVVKDTILVKTVWEANQASACCDYTLTPTQRGLWLTLLAGILGACIQVLTSLSSFFGNKRYRASWTIWFLMRPFIGGVLAILVICVFRGGLVDTNISFDGSNPFQLVAIAGLSGLFSRHALDKLQDVFDTMFKSKANDGRKDNLDA